MKKITLEIIDDEPDILELVEANVKSLFPDVHVVTRGKSCETPIAPDILVIDFLMKPTGYAQCLRCIENKCRPEVIFFSGFRDEIEPHVHAIREFGLSAQAVQKPLIEDLIQKLAIIIDRLRDEMPRAS